MESEVDKINQEMLREMELDREADMIRLGRDRYTRQIKKNDFVIISAGLPFGNAGMTNMVRLYKVGS